MKLCVVVMVILFSSTAFAHEYGIIQELGPNDWEAEAEVTDGRINITQTNDYVIIKTENDEFRIYPDGKITKKLGWETVNDGDLVPLTIDDEGVYNIYDGDWILHEQYNNGVLYLE